MPKRYFITFGSDNPIHSNGWVEVIADNREDANNKFSTRFGKLARSEYGFMNYSCCYSEAEFIKTKMYKHGNFGAYCHEVIK